MVHDWVKEKTLCQVLKMYNVGYINSMRVISLKVRKGVSESYPAVRGVRQGFVLSLWLSNEHMGEVMKETKMALGKMEMRFSEEPTCVALCGDRDRI